jgi:acyl-CoA hydrolase
MDAPSDPILEAAVDAILARAGEEIAVAAPLGLGKPHRLLNALYARVAADPARRLRIHTALSLDPPSPRAGLEGRFLAPFLARHFGEDFPRLAYAVAQKADALPANVHVEEFYLQSGGALSSNQAQSSYNALNYTHVARTVATRGIDVMVHRVALSPDGTKLSLSCNPDLSFDLLAEISQIGKPRPLLVGEVDPHLPYVGGSAEVPREFFDHVLELPGPAPKLFALPRQPVSDAEFAIGLYASTLVRDGGTLQIGIGSLSDALCHALVLRHVRNADYLRMLDALDPSLRGSALVEERGGTGPFVEGLYGASEMVNDGFMHLRRAGVLRRTVIADLPRMQRLDAGSADAADRERLERDGHWLDGAFYLGSTDLYAWLRGMPPAEARGLGMTRVSHINELYGGREQLEKLQRREARFFNTCMMATALGAAVSDALEDGRVVSGIGGQYNFVAMAHALRDGRSVLLFRATREGGGETRSSVLWSYGHCSIPRHLRDVYINEYGIADLRGIDDAGCVRAMLAITDARFAPKLLECARRALKLPAGESPALRRENSPESVARRLQPFRASGLLCDYPLGCDFTPVEQRLAKALGWLKSVTATRGGKARAVWDAFTTSSREDAEALERMQLAQPAGFAETVQAKLLKLALSKTAEK